MMWPQPDAPLNPKVGHWLSPVEDSAAVLPEFDDLPPIPTFVEIVVQPKPKKVDAKRAPPPRRKDPSDEAYRPPPPELRPSIEAPQEQKNIMRNCCGAPKCRDVYRCGRRAQ